MNLTGNIKSNAEKVLKRAAIMRETLDREIEILTEKFEALKSIEEDDSE